MPLVHLHKYPAASPGQRQDLSEVWESNAVLIPLLFVVKEAVGPRRSFTYSEHQFARQTLLQGFRLRLLWFRAAMSSDARPTFAQSLLVGSAAGLQTLLILFIGRRSSGDLRRPPILPYRHDKDASSVGTGFQGSWRILWDIQGCRKCCGWERTGRYAVFYSVGAEAEVVNSNSQLPLFSPAMRQ